MMIMKRYSVNDIDKLLPRKRLLLAISVAGGVLCASGQSSVATQTFSGNQTLNYYIDKAQLNSPLIKDLHGQTAMQQAELDRLKDMYTHSRLEVNGEYLFVPIISQDNGKTSFKFNAHDATDYYGYDLGESSGHLYAGIQWTQPLLGGAHYAAAKEQTSINQAIASNRIRMEQHQLQRSVTEQYLLCMHDRALLAFADTTLSLLARQEAVVSRLKDAGLLKQSDLQLLQIERENNRQLRLATEQSYRSHFADLNILCGTDDSEDIAFEDSDIAFVTPDYGIHSLFTEQFRLDSLRANADLCTFNLQYRPRLDLFVNAGLRGGAFTDLYRHLGWSAGISFTWTINDGNQRRHKERQTRLQQEIGGYYRDYAEYQRKAKLKQCLSEIDTYVARLTSLQRQLAEYDVILSNYDKEIAHGQRSVLDYIIVLRSRIQTQQEILLAQTNKQLAITAYNYWNW